MQLSRVHGWSQSSEFHNGSLSPLQEQLAQQLPPWWFVAISSLSPKWREEMAGSYLPSSKNMAALLFNSCAQPRCRYWSSIPPIVAVAITVAAAVAK